MKGFSGFGNKSSMRQNKSPLQEIVTEQSHGRETSFDDSLPFQPSKADRDKERARITKAKEETGGSTAAEAIGSI